MTKPPEIADPELCLFPGTTDDFSAKMDKLFADDEKREQTPDSEKVNEKPEKPTIFHKGSAFHNSKSVGFVLSSKKSEKTINLVIYDKDKTVVLIVDVDEVDFDFSEKNMTVSISIGETAKDKDPTKLVFIDKNGFQAFAINVLIRSHAHKAFILSRGAAPFDIGPDSSILYDRSIHRTDKDHSLSLPDVTRSVKTRLSAEKIENHWVYKWLCGLGKGAMVMVKVENEETVHEIQIIKTKRTTPDFSENSIHEADDEQEATLVAPTPTPRSFPNSAEATFSQQEEKIDELAPAPEISENQKTADLRDTLHRIIGIELDRIEMRLNAKFEELKQNITSRLDQQTSILEQILTESRKS